MGSPQERGRVLVLDMGTPVRVVDIARQMILMAGYRPDEDIEIKFIGLRPGEKLEEELFESRPKQSPNGITWNPFRQPCSNVAI